MKRIIYIVSRYTFIVNKYWLAIRIGIFYQDVSDVAERKRNLDS